MTTKFLIIALCMLAGTMTGLIFAKNLSRRSSYYSALVKLINAIISEVKFKKTTIKGILKDFTAINPSPLDAHLKEYIAAADISALKLSGGVIKPEELEEVSKFLLSLGSTDADTQLYELENFKSKFSALSAAAEDKRKKFGSMYIKLGFFAGLLLGILLI